MEDKARKVQDIPIQEGGYILRNDANGGAYPQNISLDFLRKQIHMSIDINEPPQTELPNQYYFSGGQENNFEAKAKADDHKRKSRMIGPMMKEHGIYLAADLKLKLSSSQQVNLSSIFNSDENLGGTSEDELPSLILMGCYRCYMYVMVPATDYPPKCSKCQNQMLLDKFRVNSTKKP